MKTLIKTLFVAVALVGLSAWAQADFKGPTSFQVPYIAPASLDAAGALALTASSDTVVVPMYVPSVCISTGIGFNAGVANGNMDVGIYSPSGQLLASAGSTPVPGTGFKSLPFTANVTLMPGTYYAAITASNTTATFVRSNSTAAYGYYRYTNSFPLPTSLTFPGTVGTRSFWLVILCQGGVNS